MKKLLFSTLFFGALVMANAQTDQGGWMVGANTNLGFQSTSVKGSSTNSSSFNFASKGGYFLADNFVAGLNFGIESSKFGDIKTSSTLIGPFARYYFGGTFFAGAGFNAVSSKSGGSSSVSGSQILLEAGYPIWATDNIAIEPSLNYAIGGGDALKDTNTFALAIGFNLYF